MISLSSIDYFTLMLLILTISLVLYTIILNVLQRKSTRESMKPRVVTRTICEGGDYNEEREFKRGEYVGQVVGTCPKCGKKLLVHAIYLVGNIKEKEH